MIDLRICALTERIEIFANGTLDEERTLRDERNSLAQKVKTSRLCVDTINHNPTGL